MFHSSSKKNKSTIVTQSMIGISYNNITGDETNISLLNLFNTLLKAPYIEINHFEITPESRELEKIYTDKHYLKNILEYAKNYAKKYIDQIDGLVIPGNKYMVDPRLFGEKCNIKKTEMNLSRSISEIALIHLAIERGMPILAICGGHQILNIYLGGKLSPISKEDIIGQGYMDYSAVKFDVDSEIAKIFSFTSNDNKSLFFGAHKYLVSKLGRTNMILNESFLKVVGNAIDTNNNIEAVESMYGTPIYSVQFHPEVSIMGMYSNYYKDRRYHAVDENDVTRCLKLFLAFITAANTYKIKKEVNPTNLKKTKKILDDNSKNIEYGLNNVNIINKANLALRNILKEVKTKSFDEIHKLDISERFNINEP